MKKIVKYLLIFLLVLSFINGGTVHADLKPAKPNITVLVFDGRLDGGYRAALSDRILTMMVESNRFNVIDRLNLESILEEQKFASSGIVDTETGARIGKIAGIDNLVVGSIANYVTEYHPAEYDQGRKVSDRYYTTEIYATIKMLDVETGKYIVATSKRGWGMGSTRENAVNDALDQLAYLIFEAFESKFKIEAEIIEVENNTYLTLNRGEADGIKKGMNFDLYDTRGIEGKKLASAKVVKLENNFAKARIFNSYSQVTGGAVAIETRKDLVLKAQILRKDGRHVIINMGKNMGIEKGNVYQVKNSSPAENEEIEFEFEFGSQNESKGLIYITASSDNYAKGKIVKGAFSIKEGMTVKEIKDADLEDSFFEVSVSTQPVSVTTHDYYYSGYGDIDSYTISTSSTEAKLTEFTYSSHSYASNIKTDFSFTTMEIRLDNEQLKSNYNDVEKLGAIMGEVSFNYNLPIIPDMLYVYPGAGIGFGFISQQAVPDYYGHSEIDDVSLLYTIKGGIRLKVKNLNLFAELNYRNMKFNDWSYTDIESDSTYEAESWKAPYSNIAFEPGLTTSLGIGISF